jgi:nucleoside-diphosphate-sugar epimerase
VTEDYAFHIENNPYSHSKVTGEMVVSTLVRRSGAPVVVVRPAWVYGPRDHASFGRFVNRIEQGKSFLIGSGHNRVPVVYVGDVAQGLIRAGDASSKAIGQAYNLADDRWVTQREYVNTIATALQVAPVSRHIPYAALYAAGRLTEVLWGSADRQKTTPPPFTTYGISLLGRDQAFSIEKARSELGYVPEFDIKRGITEGVRWYLQSKQAKEFRSARA